MKFRTSLKRIFYGLFAALFISGTVWWALEKWVRIQTPLGSDHHPLQGILLRLHGVFAYFFLVIFGYVIHSHIRPALNAKNKRSLKTGWIMILATSFLILTSATDLFGPEGDIREFLVSSHRYLGLFFPFALGLHLLNRRLYPPAGP